MAPLANVLVLALVLSAGGELGKATGLIRDLFVHRFGTPHQRLKWKAEEFFDDAAVVSLCNAIETKDIGEIDRLARAGVNINTKGRGNMTPLLWAFPAGEEVFAKILDLGADPNTRLTEDLLPRWLDKGKSVMSASVQLTDGWFRDQMLRNASMDDYLENVLRHGGNPNLEDADGDTPVFYAVPPNRMREKIVLLLNAGAEINHRNRRGETPIMSADWWRYDYVLILLQAGADYRIPDDKGWDCVLRLERLKMDGERRDTTAPGLELAKAQSVIEWLTCEGVNWEAARAALAASDTGQKLKQLPGDYKSRPWLPQRPTLKKTGVNAKE
jgi:hypothetical protein